MAFGQSWPFTHELSYIRDEIMIRRNVDNFWAFLRKVDELKRTLERWVLARSALRLPCPGCNDPERICSCEARMLEVREAEDAARALVDELHRYPLQPEAPQHRTTAH